LVYFSLKWSRLSGEIIAWAALEDFESRRVRRWMARLAFSGSAGQDYDVTRFLDASEIKARRATITLLTIID
jgi:hypothetical protein